MENIPIAARSKGRERIGFLLLLLAIVGSESTKPSTKTWGRRITTASRSKSSKRVLRLRCPIWPERDTLSDPRKHIRNIISPCTSSRSRTVASQGRYPAIDKLSSTSPSNKDAARSSGIWGFGANILALRKHSAVRHFSRISNLVRSTTSPIPSAKTKSGVLVVHLFELVFCQLALGLPFRHCRKEKNKRKRKRVPLFPLSIGILCSF